jgi:hypothetical protein
MSQYVEKIAFLGIDNLLHLGHLLFAKALLREPMQQLGPYRRSHETDSAPPPNDTFD